MALVTHLRTVVTGLALAAPVGAAADVSVCDALHQVSAVVLLPAEERQAEANDGTLPYERARRLRLIASAERMLDASSAERVLPAQTLARFREILADQAAQRATEAGAQPALSDAERDLLQRWLQSCAQDERAEPVPGDHESIQTLETDETSMAADAGRRLAIADTPRGGSGASVDIAPSWQTLMILVGFFALALLSLPWHAIWRKPRQRRARRFRCKVPSTLVCDAGRITVQMEDISQLGCLLRTDSLIELKTPCLVHVAGHWLRGRIVWSNKCYAGVEFGRYMSIEFVHAVARRRAPTGREDPAIAAARGGLDVVKGG